MRILILLVASTVALAGCNPDSPRREARDPLPEFYGVYAIHDGQLLTLERLTGRLQSAVNMNGKLEAIPNILREGRVSSFIIFGVSDPVIEKANLGSDGVHSARLISGGNVSIRVALVPNQEDMYRIVLDDTLESDNVYLLSVLGCQDNSWNFRCYYPFSIAASVDDRSNQTSSTPGHEARATLTIVASGPEGRALANHVVLLLPYDRDSIFDLLARRAGHPRPEFPSDLQASLQSLPQLQHEWRHLEDQWSEVRDEVRVVSTRLEASRQGTPEHQALRARFEELEQRERKLNHDRSEAFQRVDRAERETLERAEHIRQQREEWENIWYRDFGSIVDSIVAIRKAEARTDTIGADGTLTTSLVGTPWWVHTRVSIPFGELYWNVPVNPASVDTLYLTQENAQQRERL